MILKSKLFILALTCSVGMGLHAQETLIWTGGDGAFSDPNSWDIGRAPAEADTAIVDNGATLTINEDQDFATLELGNGGAGTSGHVIMNGGNVLIAKLLEGQCHGTKRSKS